jgi:hypothetical protein
MDPEIVLNFTYLLLGKKNHTYLKLTFNLKCPSRIIDYINVPHSPAPN